MKLLTYDKDFVDPTNSGKSIMDWKQPGWEWDESHLMLNVPAYQEGLRAFHQRLWARWPRMVNQPPQENE